MKRWCSSIYIYRVLIVFSVMGLTSCNAPEAKYEKHLHRGDSYYEQGDYIKARLEYKNAAKIIPTDPRAIYALGLVEEAEGNLQSALSAFLVTEQQSPDFKPVLIKLAEFFLTVQQADEVKTRIGKVLEQDPENTMAHALKGSLFLKERDFDKARQEIQIVLDKEPAHVVAHSVRVGIFLAEDNPDKALSALDEAIALNAKELSFYLLKAAVYSEKNDLESVSRIYHEIFALYPEEIRFRFDLGLILQEAGKLSEAEAVYKETVHDFSESSEAKKRLAVFMEEYNSTEAAEQEIRSFIETAPDQQMFYLWLADLYARNDDYDRAIAMLKNIVESEPDDWIGLNARTVLAEIQLERGDLKRAEDMIDAVLEENVNNRDALFLRANLAFVLGDYQKAVVDLRAILRDYPDSLKASRILAEALVIQERVDLARDTLLQAVQKYPEDKGTLVRLAQLYVLGGSRIKAMEILESVTGLDPSYAIGWEALARLAIENEQWSKARHAVLKLGNIDGYAMTALFLKGQIEEKNEGREAAIALYEQVIKADPSAPLVAYALTALLEAAPELRDLERVKSFLRTLGDTNPTILTVLGAVEESTNDLDAAEMSFRKAISLKPRNQDAYIALAKIFMKQGHKDKALEILEKAENLLSAKTAASLMRADILMQARDMDSALAIYEGVIARDDQAIVVANNYAQIVADFQYKDAAALDRARLVAEQFINSDNPYFLDTLGWVYYRQGLFPQAQPVLARAISLLKEPNSQVDYHYGALLLEMGQPEEAKIYLQRAVGGPDYTGIDDARALLEKMK